MNSLEITHEILSKWQESSLPFTLIDIREEDERAEAHMGGESIPLSELAERVDELPPSSIVFYCRSGARSLLAARKLREVLQREDIYSLSGGMLALA